MRCISPYQDYSIQVIEGRETIVMDARGFGSTQVLEKPVVADFQVGGLLDHEIDAALESFSFSGLPEGVNPLTRISSFDSEAYVLSFPEDQQNGLQVKIDTRLRELAKRFPTEFMIVESKKPARPWPSYDDDSVKDILSFQGRLRVKPEYVRRYELDNKNRPEIVLAMLKLEDPAEAERYEAELTGKVIEKLEAREPEDKWGGPVLADDIEVTA